jgi:hypothetical protein
LVERILCLFVNENGRDFTTIFLFFLSLQKLAISGACSNDSRTRPSALLQLNLTFERFGEINDEKLNETATECNASEQI